MNKNRKGFTLMELLVVIVIVAVVGVGASISFNNINDSTAQVELENKYMEIQRAATLYLDLHNSSLDTFIENKEMYMKLYVLKELNYINDMENPVTGDDISSDYFVKTYIPSDGKKVDTCILSIDLVGTETCIANSKGKRCGCCDLAENPTLKPSC